MIIVGSILYSLWVLMFTASIWVKEFNKCLATPELIVITLLFLSKIVVGVISWYWLLPLIPIWGLYLWKDVPRKNFKELKELIKEKPARWWYTINFKKK